ncbi:LPS export ABC transporter permease LptG [Ferruginivarius sediminum]|uniref:LPS export ABC transporter permease LptG n=1 Tax=Ferruginivarius sediminum TaxID=2661937 RepID=A0A369TAR4_9PROT|nr:LPS export ABC transporter permease LptG [Ferruginivarius sediminum]RDD62409.1 LPS export ABC transporter permease LptG [Ferruginivarius sediminum]
MARSAVAVRPRIRSLRLSLTMSGYIARHFTARFVSLLLVLLGIILLVSTVELLDQLATKEGVSLWLTVQLALLKLPHLGQEVMPFTILFAAMATFWRLTRSNELVVVRAAGVSVWQFLLPIIAVGLAIGILTTTVINPVASVMLRRYEQLEAQYTGKPGSTTAVSKNGLWLRQADGDGVSVIHARRVSQETMVLHDVIVFRYAEEDRFTSRIDAQTAKLQDGHWQLYDALKTRPGDEGESVEQMRLPTELTADKIYNSFAPPETVSFWALPGFIDLLENAGFTAEPQKLQFHRLLAKPVLLAAMILLAATFSLRPHRRGKVAIMIVSGVLVGFLLYILSNLVFALGLSSKLPVVLAAWTPAGVTLMLGIASLLHLEDG